MKWSADIPEIVEPSRDGLGWLLVYSCDVDGYRAGDPYGDPDSPSGRYKNRAAAKRKADDINGAHRELLARARK